MVDTREKNIAAAFEALLEDYKIGNKVDYIITDNAFTTAFLSKQGMPEGTKCIDSTGEMDVDADISLDDDFL